MQGERGVDPVSQVFSRIRAHLERTQAQQLSWAQLLDLMGTSFKVGGGLGGWLGCRSAWESAWAKSVAGLA